MTDEKKLIHQGNLISLYKERVDLPDDKHTHFDIVSHPGGSVIAAINDQNEVCLLKQWRHAVRQFVWEFPAGCIEENEEPLIAAKRELEEETGVVAQEWQDLGHILATPGYSNEVLYFFRAENLSTGTLNLDDAEQLEAHWLPLDDIYEMVKTGKISDAKTMALLTKILLSQN